MTHSVHPRIALMTSDQGHGSIAQGILDTLKKQYQVDLFHDQILLNEVYRLFYRYSPHLFKYLFSQGENPLVEQSSQTVARYYYQDQVNKFFQGKSYDLIISTYAFFLPSVLSFETLPPLINILSDPRTISPVLVSEPPVLNLSFDQTATNVVLRHKPTAVVETTGWFVATEFEKQYSPRKIKQKLGLNPNLPIFLIVTGSEGQRSSLPILKGLLKATLPLQLIVVSGNNARLKYETDQVFANLAADSPYKHLNIGFTDQLATYMQAADLVIGKAGPNTLFEAVATHTPFFATSHIHGQEDGNLEIITEYQLGFVEENARKAITKLKRLAQNPRHLDAFQPALKKMAAYNRGAKQRLLDLIPRLIAGHQPITFP
jgi:UDP-N-acetylglucosamine:LPS N-acetylglucosamine transferase